MKAFLVSLFPAGSLRGWIVRGYAKNPLRFSLAILRSLIANLIITGTIYPLLVRIETGQTLKASRGKNARAELLGVLSVAGWGGSNLPSSLMLGKDSSLRILGDLSIGPNVHISTSTGATVEFGGVRHSSGSGITCNSRIMAEKCIKVGADSIIAWDVLVTDSDWHNIDGSQRIETVEIGERVWIAHGVSVLKGSYIPHGSVVGAKSLVQKRFSGNSLLLAGNPARIIREAVRWER